MIAEPLMEHVPGRQAEIGAHLQGDREPPDDKTDKQRQQPLERKSDMERSHTDADPLHA